MRPGKAPRARKGFDSKPASYSTSKARANFASALETTDRLKMIVGFARYKRTVAALVPIEAVRMLAGNNNVDPGVRTKIVRLAQAFVAAAEHEGPAEAPAPRKTAKKKAAKRAKAKKAKKAVAKRRGLGKFA